MAEATDRNTTSNWISWDEVLARAGSSEALLFWLRETPILARHQGLYYSPSGKTRSGPGKFDPDWWAQARVDPATGRVIFPMPEKYQLFFTGFAGDPAPPAIVPRVTDEVFAFGIELERGVAEVRFPAQPKPPEPERVETPAPVPPHDPPRSKEDWLERAQKAHPKRRAESKRAWAKRLYAEMLADPAIDVWPSWKTLERSLYPRA
jgi:hypothetical protein